MLNFKPELREKTHTEAMADGSLGKIHINKLHELVGFIEPNADGTWEVTMTAEGCGYSASTQSEATVIGSLEEIKLMLVKLLRSVGTGNAK